MRPTLVALISFDERVTAAIVTTLRAGLPAAQVDPPALAALHDEALRVLGGDRAHPPAGTVELLGGLRDRARALLADDSVTVTTDPAAVFLLDGWQRVARVRVAAVVLGESDRELAELAARHQLEPEDAARLWLRTAVAAREHNPAVWASAQEWSADPAAVAERLLSAFGAGGAGIDRSAPTAPAAPPLPAAPLAADGPLIRLARTVSRALGESQEALAAALAAAAVALERDRSLLAEQAQTRSLRRELAGARQQAARSQRELRTLVSRRGVRHTLRAAQAAAPLVEAARALGSVSALKGAASVARNHLYRVARGARAGRGVRGRARGVLGALTARRRASSDDEERLAAALRSDAERVGRPELVPTPPRVSVVILNRSGEHHLRRCLPALARTDYPDLEVVVVDNASDDGSLSYLDQLAPPFPLRVLRNTENRSFSAANNQGIAAATGELILLLNNDVEPVETGWLRHMVTTLDEWDAAAVGARLIYPRRPRLDNAGDAEFRDLSVQHRGIGFVPGDGVPLPRNLGRGEDPLSAPARRIGEAAAVTAACMLVRRSVLAAVEGLTEGYVYGVEDVDLCLKLHAAGHTVVYDGEAVLWHHEFGTQNRDGRRTKRLNREHNRQVFLDRWGPRVAREVLADRIRGGGIWSEAPLHVAITVTRDDPSAGFGDWFTAHELGDALAGLGWRISYVERHRDRWYRLPADTDVLVVLLDAYDIAKAPPNVVTVAWVRNWTQRWVGHPWFDDYDVVLASSEGTRRIVAEQSNQVAQIMPLATNPERFQPVEPEPDLRCDIVFTGSYWNAPRDVETALPVLAEQFDVAVYGRNWERVEALRPLHRGLLDYDRLAAAYSSATLVVDDTAGHTKPYGAINSRVFDALAAGKLVLTNNVAVREVFDTDFPVWRDAEELTALCLRLSADAARREELVERYRGMVLSTHTYRARADQVRRVLTGWLAADRIGICIGVPGRARAEAWGDYHFARALQRQFERRGHPTRVHLLPEWVAGAVARDDVVLHLFGLSELGPRPAQTTVLWNISHPELVSAELCNSYDLVCVASASFAKELADVVDVEVVPLVQCTDPERFSPDPTGPVHDLLFVANSRRSRRRIVDDLGATPHDFAVYGRYWSADLIDQRYVRGDHVPNAELRRYYSSAKLVLNDHWPDMRAHGFLSNRLYDALACGACVVSDHVDGIAEEFDDAVVTYRDADDLRRTIERLLADPAERTERGERGRKAVLARHTFAHRVDELLGHLGHLLDERPRSVTR